MSSCFLEITYKVALVPLDVSLSLILLFTKASHPKFVDRTSPFHTKSNSVLPTILVGTWFSVSTLVSNAYSLKDNRSII